MAVTKPSVKPAWAENVTGNTDHVVEPNDAYKQAGWPLTDEPPPRQYFNWVLNWLANAARYFMRAGVSEWDAAESYVLHDLTRGSDGVLRRLTTANSTNQNPTVNVAWGSPLVPTAAANDATTKAASTAYVIQQASVTLPLMDGTPGAGVAFTWARADHVHPKDTSKADTTGNYPSMAVGDATRATQVPWAGVQSRPTTVSGYGIIDAITTGNINQQSVLFAQTANRANPRRSDGTAWDFYWSGLGGQPNWLLGSNDGVTVQVYNPANFSVNYAASAGAVAWGNVTSKPNVGLMPGVVIAPDPGGIPGGTPGTIYLYF